MADEGEQVGAGRGLAAGLFVLAVLASVVAIPLQSWFRAEDLLDFAHYHRIGLVECFTLGHLDTVLVSFYRPLSDALTWLLVRGIGPEATGVHAVLLALHVLVALMVARALRSILGGGWGPGLVAGTLVLAHPFVPLVVLYLDGGVAQLCFALCVAGAVEAAARWRRRRGGGVAMTLWTLGAVFSFDGGLAFPIGLFLAAGLAPGGERRFAWWLLAAVPLALLVRDAVLGTPLGGYALAPSRANVEALREGLPQVARETLLPVFGDRHDPEQGLADLHAAALEGVALGVAAVVLLGLLVAGITRPGGAARNLLRGLRWTLAGGVLFGAVFGPGALEAGLGMGRGGAFAPSFGYRLYPAIVPLALLLGGLAAGALGRRRGAWLVPLLAPVAIGWFLLGQALRDGAAAAGERARVVRDGVLQLASEQPEDDRPFVVLGTPLNYSFPSIPRDMGRCLHYGLADALRPPLSEVEVEAFPVFSARGSGDLVITPAGIERLLQSPALRCVQYDPAEDQVFAWPTAEATPSSFELLPPSGLRRDPRRAGAEAETVRVDEEGRLRLRVRGETPGVLRLVIVSKLHPYYAWELYPLSCRRIEDPDRDSDVLEARATQFREVARREPDELCFALLEQLPRQEISPASYAAAVASPVLVIRLSPGD